MRRELATFGGARQMARPARSIASLVFVGLLGAAFWAGAVYVGEMFLTMGSLGY